MNRSPSETRTSRPRIAALAARVPAELVDAIERHRQGHAGWSMPAAAILAEAEAEAVAVAAARAEPMPAVRRRALGGSR